MKLDYGTQLSPEPIKLSIGTIKKPKLSDIAELGFDLFDLYEMFLKLTPEVYYTKLKSNDGKVYWESLSDEQRQNITLYDIIVDDDSLRKTYQEIFNFFFVEAVVYNDGLFFLLKSSTDIANDNIIGVINRDIFPQVIDLIQQICCINEKDESPENLKFKSEKARARYMKMLEAEKAKKTSKKADNNLSLPNIISAVSNMHPSISIISIWDLTIFQLIDSFIRLQENIMYGVNCLRVATWGDEKKQFDATAWYKNRYDN